MANVTITQLPTAGTLAGTESVPIVQNGVTVQTTTGAIAGAPFQGQTFITVNQESSLANSRALTQGNGISITAGAPQGNITVALANSFAVSGSITASNIDGIIGATTPAAGSFTNITGSANAVIEVTDNTNAALRVTQLGTGNALLIEDSANPDSSPFVIDSEGRVGVGGVPVAGQSIRLSKTMTGSINSYGIFNVGAVQSDVTSNAFYFRTNANTAASAFTLTAIGHYNTLQSTIGAGSTVTNQYGFFADASLTGATNNFGFFSNIAAGTARYNFYAQGTADNYFAGKVGIGTPPQTAESLRVSPTASAVATTYGIRELTSIDQTTTTTAGGILSQTNIISPAAVNILYRFYALQGTFTGTVTTQYGFVAESNLTGATNNYGFVSNIPAAANRYNIYSSGTATNYFAGSTGVGTIAPQTKLEVAESSSGNTVQVIRLTNANSTANTGAGIQWNLSAASTTLNGEVSVYRDTAASGIMLFKILNINTATLAEAMRIDSVGNVGIGAAANASALLDVQSTTKGVRMPNMTTTQKNAIASPAAGLMVFDTTLAKLCVYTGAAWQTITST